MSTAPKTKIEEIGIDTDSKLPEGWVSITLEDHIYIAGRIGWRGLKAEEYKSSGPMLVSVPNLNHGDLVDFGTVDHISVARYEESPEIQLHTDDILLAKDGAGIGKLGYVGELTSKATINSSLLLIRPGDQLLLPRYLFYFLKGPEFQSIALNRITGSATPHLFQKDIKLFPVLVPPLPEQSRIVTKVEHSLNRVKTLRGMLARSASILKTFRQAVLAAACSGRLTEDWREKHQCEPASSLLKRILEERLKGSRGKFDLAEPNEPIDVPSSWVWASGSQLFSWGSGKFLPAKEQKPGTVPVYGGNGILGQHDRALVEHKTLVIGRVGAQCGNVNTTTGPTWVTDNAIYALSLPSGINLEFIGFVFKQSNLNANAGGSGQPFVNQTTLNAVAVPLPPTDEQHEIVRRAEALFKLADAIEKRVNAASARAEKLTQAILATAFRGELVPTEAELARREGRHYEPASVLLERIKAERAAAEAGNGKKGGKRKIKVQTA